MDQIPSAALPLIAPEPGYAPVRSVTACRLDQAFEVRLQDVVWPHSGQSLMQTGARWTFDFQLDAFDRAAQYSLAGPRGLSRPAGRLNFMAPRSLLDLQWSRGQRRSFMCVFDPARLGLPHQQLQRWQGVDPLAVLDIHNPRLEATMGWLCGELLQPSFASQLHITSMLTLLTLETQRHFGGPLPPEETGSRLNGRQWSLVKELIEQAPPAELSVRQLARACGVPGRNFPAMFRRTVGMPLRSFVAATHIEKAKLLLSDPQLLVKQVAMRSGFESASGFALAFRKATGMTPQQYREAQGLQSQPVDAGS